MAQNYGEFSALSRETYPLAIPQMVRIKCRAMAEALKDRIAQRLTELDMSARGASLEAGLAPDTLGKVLSGKTQNLRGDNLTAVARVLKTTESWLTSGEGRISAVAEKTDGIRYGGIVEAGAFRLNDSTNQDAEYRTVPLAPDPRYPAASQFAFEVQGDSMDKARMFPALGSKRTKTRPT